MRSHDLQPEPTLVFGLWGIPCPLSRFSRDAVALASKTQVQAARGFPSEQWL